MKVWLLQIGEPLPIKVGVRKMRTALLADELVNRGHDVTWWASCFDHFSKKWLHNDKSDYILSDNYRLKLLKGFRYKKNISLQRFIDHRIIAKRFRYMAPKSGQPDIIIASFPSYDLAYEACIYAKANDIPIIVDVRDQWPDIFTEYLPHSLAPIILFLLRREINMAREALRTATSLTSMMNHLLDWSLDKAGRVRRDDDRVFYLGAHRPNPVSEDESIRLKELDGLIAGKFVVLFIGTFGNYYNPMIFIEAAKGLREHPIHFIIGGDGSYGGEVREAARGLMNVSFTGWLNQSEIACLLSKAHLGVVPCTTRIQAFPNKVFTYFSAGLPIISSLDGELKDILQKHQLGIYYEPNDTVELITHIKQVVNDIDKYKSLKKNVCKYFDEMYDANLIYKRFADHVELVSNKERTINIR